MGERGTWEVPVGGLKEMYFFWESFRAREVVIQKNDGQTPPPTDFAAISTGVEWEFGSV